MRTVNSPSYQSCLFSRSLALIGAVYRLDFNDPPTAVGGIRGEALPDWCRLELNDPPTSVGGIRETWNWL
jgi:hypothetical protein